MSILNSLRSALVCFGTAAALLIAGCGGSSSGDAAPAPTPAPPTESTPDPVKQVEAAKKLRHTAALGLLADAKVEVRDAFDKSETVLYTTTTDGDGMFNVELPAYDKNTMFLVTVTGGKDLDVRDTGVRDAVPTPSAGSISALVAPIDLLTGAIRVTWLSDAAYRLIGGDLSRFDPSTLNIELNRLAGLLLKKSLLVDGTPVSADLLQFDATAPEHRQALAFDAESLWAEDEDGMSLIKRYHAGSEEVSQGWRQITSAVEGVTPTLAEEMVRNTAKIQAAINGIGRIDSTLLPNGRLLQDDPAWSSTVPKDDSVIALQAVETDTNWRFDSWTGCTRVRGNRCEVEASADINVMARFALAKAEVKAEVSSLGRLTQGEGLTGVRFDSAGTASIVTRDAAATAFLRTLKVGSIIQTGDRERPTVRVKRIITPAMSVQAGVMNAQAAPLTTVQVEVEDATPLDVYDEVSIIADATPVAFDEVRAITLSDGVGGEVRTVLPPPDYTTSVVEGSVLGTAPTWYVTRTSDGSACRAYGADVTARGALLNAWQDEPRGYPFTEPALAQCVALGRFTVEGDLTDYVMGKSMGESDQMSGRHDGTGKLAMRAAEPAAASDIVRVAGTRVERQAEPVWVSGVGAAVPLGNNLFLATRENSDKGLRLIALENMQGITTAQAAKQAMSDCSERGVAAACGLIAGLERERQGLRSVGMIPLLTTPISVTFSKPNSKFSATVALSFNIDIKPKASFSWSISSQWVRASAGADYTVAPELSLTAAFGETKTFTVPGSSKQKKFNRNNTASKTAKKESVEKTLITIDLGRAIPYAGAVLDLSLNLVVGVDAGGEFSITAAPRLTLAGDFGVSAYYEWRCCRSNDRELNAWLNMPTVQPGISVQAKGMLFVEPYAEANIAAGLRGVAPQVAKVYVRGGIQFRGEVATGFSYGTKFRDVRAPDTWAEGRVQSNSAKYWEDCSLDTRVRNGGSCSCTSDLTHTQKILWWTTTVVLKKCVQRGVPTMVPGKITKIPQRCFDSPEFAAGIYAHVRAGAKTSSQHFAWPFNGWLSFINKDFAFFDKEWPIFEYPQKDNQPGSDLAGCKDI